MLGNPLTRRDGPELQLRPRILYFTRVDFPSQKANSIQSINTCYELARQGASVILVVRRLLRSRQDCFTFYGLPEHPRLRIISLALPMQGEFNEWKGDVFRNYLAAFLQRQRSACTVLMTRDPAGLELLDIYRTLRPSPGLLTLFEVHNVSYLVKADHQPQSGRALDDPEVQAKRQARRHLEGGVYASAGGLICISENARRVLQETFTLATPTCVVPNGTRIPCGADGVPVVERELNDAPRDLDVLYVGQLYRCKGVDTLVRAMAYLPGRRLNVVGGSGPQDVDRLRVVAAAEGVVDRIDFVGFVPPAAVVGYLQRARVGVVPLPHNHSQEATWFTSPLKLFDLMRAGVPVVASDLPSIREILGPDTGELVPPDDPQALANAIGRLLEDRTHAARLVRAAAERVLDFSWEARARRILAFVGELHPEPQRSQA